MFRVSVLYEVKPKQKKGQNLNLHLVSTRRKPQKDTDNIYHIMLYQVHLHMSEIRTHNLRH